MQSGVLITGGAGFIGCAVSAKIAEKHAPVSVIDSLHPQIHPQRQRPAQMHRAVELIEREVQNEAAWADVLSEFEPEVIVHLAAETGTGQSLTEASRHADVNVLGTARMLDALSVRNIRPRHMIVCSSRAVYGEGSWQSVDGRVLYPEGRSPKMLREGRWDPVAPGDGELKPLPHNAERTETRPISIYGTTKLAQEQLLRIWCRAYEVPLTVLRLQNVYGPGQSPFNSYTGIITLFHRQAAAGKQISVYEDGQIVRDFVYIDDVANVVATCIENPPECVRTVDVGTGVPITIEHAAGLIAEMYNAPAPMISGQYRNGDVRWACADPEPLREELAVPISVSFAEGSRRVGEWLGEQKLS